MKRRVCINEFSKDHFWKLSEPWLRREGWHQLPRSGLNKAVCGYIAGKKRMSGETTIRQVISIGQGSKRRFYAVHKKDLYTRTRGPKE